jgi:GNAT superfamily N-acetyltransferase
MSIRYLDASQIEFDRLPERFPWVPSKFLPTEPEDGYALVLLVDDESLEKEEMKGLAILYHNPEGVCLNREIHYPKIQWKVRWLEVHPDHRKKGYGSILVRWIRDRFANKKAPIALYALKSFNCIFGTSVWARCICSMKII